MVQKGVKSRRESVELYEQGDRPELAAAERDEIAVLERYLPARLTGAELEAAVDAVIQAVGATTMKDMGAVMRGVLDAHGGAVDGKDVQTIVKSRLGG